MSTTLQLTTDLFIAKGSHKQCFRHPQNNRLCIKVPYNAPGQTDLNREIYYLTHILKQRGEQSGVLPRYYGPVKTNLGVGHVFDLICDTDGKISPNIEQILTDPALTTQQLQAIHQHLFVLRDHILQYRLICMSMYPENILYQQLDADTFRLMLINDMGSSSSFPFEYYLPFLAKTKIKRYWNRFIQNSLPKRLPAPIAQQLADLVFK